MRNITLLAPILALAACGSDPEHSGTTRGEAQALDDAAAMIEEKRLPESALRPPAGQAADAGAPQK